MRPKREIVHTLTFSDTGVTVANFCSSLQFKFDYGDKDGISTLAACSIRRAVELFPILGVIHLNNATLVQRGFSPDPPGAMSISVEVKQISSDLPFALDAIQKRSDINYILVDRPSAEILRDQGLFNGKLRMPLVVDKRTQTMSHEVFECVSPLSFCENRCTLEPYNKQHETIVHRVRQLQAIQQ